MVMDNLKRQIGLLGVVILSLWLVGCSDKQTLAESSIEQQILHQGNGAEPQDLDPQIITGVPEHYIMSALFEGLISENPKDLSPEPGVAKSWQVSPDQTIYTFFLNKEAKWSDSTAIGAKDFVYAWERILTPSLGAQYAYMLYPVKNAEAFHKGEIKDFSTVGVKAIDTHTLQVTLHSPTPYFLRLLQHYSTFPVPKHVIEKYGAMAERGTKWTLAGNLVSNGPFQLAEWELNKVVRVERNPHYWDADIVKLNEIHFYPIESYLTEERNFRSGRLHVTYEVPNTKIETYQKENPELIRISPYLGTYYYRINTSRKPFDNAKVRHALAMSIDRDLLVKKVTKAGELPAYNFTPPNTAGYTAKARTEYNIEKAKQLLAEAGYPDGKGFPQVDILYNTNDNHKVIAEAIQQMWKKALNINVGIYNQDWKVYLNSQKTLDYDICRAGWIGDYPDPNNFLDMFLTEGGNNNTGWSNADYDALIVKAGQTSDPKTRLELFQQAETILMDEMPVIPIYTYTRKKFVSPFLKGWHENILDHHPYKYVYLSKD